MTNLEKYMEEIEEMFGRLDTDCELYHFSTDTSVGCPVNMTCKECCRESLHWLAEEESK